MYRHRPMIYVHTGETSRNSYIEMFSSSGILECEHGDKNGTLFAGKYKYKWFLNNVNKIYFHPLWVKRTNIDTVKQKLNIVQAQVFRMSFLFIFVDFIVFNYFYTKFLFFSI